MHDIHRAHPMIPQALPRSLLHFDLLDIPVPEGGRVLRDETPFEASVRFLATNPRFNWRHLFHSFIHSMLCKINHPFFI
jgi:hypothetical protein